MNMPSQNQKKINIIGLVLAIIFIAFVISPIFGFIVIVGIIVILIKRPNNLNDLKTQLLAGLPPSASKIINDTKQTILLNNDGLKTAPGASAGNIAPVINNFFTTKVCSVKLERRKKYLQIALNSTLDEARQIISRLPQSNRILIEAGTPLIKIYGTTAVSRIKNMAPSGSYIVADNKCADLAEREVELMSLAGASAATCLGVAPVETIDRFIEACARFNMDSMLDMMNVESALAVLKKIKKPPSVVMLHRGVDESEFSKEKQIPYYQIKQIKGNYNVLVSVAGGDSIQEVQKAFFNDADIVVVWKNFYEPGVQTAQLAASFLKEVKHD